jgi:molybdenum cofactor cytidylyltransferase
MPTASCIWKSFQTSGKKHLILTGDRGSGKTTLLSALFPCPMPGLTSWAVPKQGVYLKDNFSSKTVQIGRFNPDSTGTENRMLPVLDAFSQTGVSFLLTGSPSMKSDISKAPVPNIKTPSLS